jgi:hypothetical protein
MTVRPVVEVERPLLPTGPTRGEEAAPRPQRQLKASSSDKPIDMCSTAYRGIGFGSFDIRMPSLVASS